MSLLHKLGDLIEHAPALIDKGIDHAAYSIEGQSVLAFSQVYF